MTTKAMTLRLLPEIYKSTQQIAQQRHISLNTLIQDSLRDLIHAEQQRKLFDDFTLLGEDAAGNDVEYAFAAQCEVIMMNGRT